MLQPACSRNGRATRSTLIKQAGKDYIWRKWNKRLSNSLLIKCLTPLSIISLAYFRYSENEL